MSQMHVSKKIDSKRFYSEYHGHLIQHLEVIHEALRDSSESLIWTAGDSSLDNKYWFNDQRPAVGAYKDVLDPPFCNADVTYWLNSLLKKRQYDSERNRRPTSLINVAAINTAVEATTVNERTYHLRPQDRFVRDNIRPDDFLVVSIGGNDVAMAPAPCTIISILSLMCCLPTSCLESGCIASRAPCNDYCCGCGASTLSCFCACPPCFGYMVHLFGIRVQKYIEKLTAKTKPKKILICMIYYPDENNIPSWAGPALGVLGYNSNPQKLQLMIRRAFVEATSKIVIPGSEVIPVPLFNVLDGKNSHDYIARVEPSSQGGKKMAEYLLDVIDSQTPSYGAVRSTTPGAPTAVEASYMAER